MCARVKVEAMRHEVAETCRRDISLLSDTQGDLSRGLVLID